MAVGGGYGGSTQP
jgi:hypothetical protein